MSSAVPLPPTEDGWEYTFVGDLKPGDEVRTLGVVREVMKGILTQTVYFNNEDTPWKPVSRTWHEFHSVEVKKKES